MSAVTDELKRLEAEAAGVLKIARDEYEAALKHADACKADLMAAEDSFKRIAGGAARAIRPRVLMANEERIVS